MSEKFDKANDAVRTVAADARRDGKAQRAAALEAVLTVTKENAAAKRTAMRALIAEALAGRTFSSNETLDDDTHALALADASIAYAQYGYGEYAGAAARLTALIGEG
jgi:hypothetical protein